ncbi:MAG: hypothetical protein P4L64_03715 [Caulobacteraceae bacterium]|nr:hypothetical protein [Caulobacteraceae bacterium]
MSLDAFDETHTRRREVAWQSPAAVRGQVDGLSGLAIMRGIRDGTIPPPPMARLIGFACVKAEAGEIAGL